ncbi:FHA domain-containing protein [Allocoleopsis franciscana]|uniref:Response regulator with CheY-like receiver, AAA-type ATPase, and DNA-binding domains n=1 Tax=Allocoleopsis franciscana PCC 7113 TaxID=1173027 RepID=K9WQC0_9CYAN|nr:FHA domain-containing protein [Allocoleopsis franciscana]AFZ22378.1 response regulator with CheY-like receiver, AAA-type ATPase, and DNA-binding domains [Allocoleopsis franciscana PCC 7113]
MAINIVLIEKDDNVRSNWRELLQLFSYQVSTAHSLEKVKSINELIPIYFDHIDVVVADTDLVGMDALKLKQLLNNDYARIPLILTSASNVPEWTLDRDELGAVAFLRKPFENSILLEYVSKALKIKSLFEQDLDSSRAIAKLLITQPNELPVEIALKRSYTMGRYRSSDEFHADIRLNSPSASRKHCFLIRIYKGKDSYYKLIDFSSNGILINGRRMPKMARLNHNDEIELYPECRATYTEIARESNDLDVTLTNKDD